MLIHILTPNNGFYCGIGVNPTINSSFEWNNWQTVQAGTEYIIFVTTRWYLQTGVHRFWLSFQGQVVTQHPDLFDNPACQLANATLVADATNIKVYPNPFNDGVTLKTEDVITKIEVYSLLGKKVHQQTFAKKIDLSFLAKGVYAIRLYSADGEVYTKKLIKK